jgi:hypothetical protein
MDTGWTVALVLYVLGVYAHGRGKQLRPPTYDLFFTLVWIGVIITWPILIAGGMISSPIYQIWTRKWPTCDICDYKTREIKYFRNTKYCPKCYVSCVDEDDRQKTS